MEIVALCACITGKYDSAIAVCNVSIRIGGGNLVALLALCAERIAYVCGIGIRSDGNFSSCLNHKGENALNTAVGSVVIEFRLVCRSSNSLIVLYCLKACSGGEIKTKTLGNCGIGVRILKGYGNGSSLAAVGEDYIVAAFYILVYCGGVYCIIGKSNNRVVGVVSLYHCVGEIKLITENVVDIHTRNLDLGKSRSLGSLFTGIDNNGIDVKVACGKDDDLGLFSIVLSEHICAGGAYTVKGEVIVLRIGLNGNGCTCCNGELNESACLHIKSVRVGVPSNLAVLCADNKAVPLKGRACCNSSSGIKGVAGSC